MLNQALILPAGCSEFDRRFASTLQGFEVDPHPDVFVAAALVSAATGQGRICLALEEFAERAWPSSSEPEEASCGTWQAPSVENWTAILRRSAVVGDPGSFRPLVLDGAGRLYLQRYWRYEHQLAVRLHAMSLSP